ncbi:unknown protein [Simkania negevensis Z]|uniref:Uncharacterized protein n=1 Tax=Simkania negevensis (strain ATCC VR-1471 / DSM 27360 / Z) TaxID=331113 RepID=F8L6S1_SIMNZ|nr:unknown protein [Simkania negevensis Z]
MTSLSDFKKNIYMEEKSLFFNFHYL